MTTNTTIQPTDVILASGGAKGITANCVVQLAALTGCRFILVGRSTLAESEPAWAQGLQDPAELKRRIMEAQKAAGQAPSPKTVQQAFHTLVSQREIQTTLDAVHRAGGQAIYLSADAANTADLRQKLVPAVEQLGPITGILHGAGSLADKRIEKKTLKEYEKVFHPKVKGLESLAACVSLDRLQFIVLFSSVAGFYGNVGQTDYALANEILNKTAFRLQHQYPACRVMTINWGPWEAGMVTPQLKKAFEAQNITMIPVEIGTRILANQLTRPEPVPTQVVVGSSLSRPAVPVSEGQTLQQIERILRLADNPFLQDHRIGGNPVLPATCSLSWMIHSCEQLFPGYVCSQVQDYRVLKGIVFEDQASQKYTLDVKHGVPPTLDTLQLETTVWSRAQNNRPRFHYRARIRLQKSLLDAAPGAPFSAAELADPAAIAGQEFYKNGTLFHGPAFQGIQRVLRISDDNVRMEISLPEPDARTLGQFPARSTNPYVNDAIVQSLLVWSMEYYQAPCLPASLEKLEIYRPLPFGVTCQVDLQVRSHSATSVLGNLLVQDPAGQPYLRFIGLEGTISKQLARHIGKKQPAAQMTEMAMSK